MKKTMFLFLFFGQFLIAQKQQILQLPLEEIEISNRRFYIKDVIDTRPEKAISIGLIYKGIFNTPNQAVLENGLENALFNYYENALPKEEGQLGVDVKIKKIQVSEKNKMGYEQAFAEVVIEYYFQKHFLFRNLQKVKAVGRDVWNSHARNIGDALQKSLFEFSKIDWQTRSRELAQLDPTGFQNRTTQKMTLQKRQADQGKSVKNVLAVGYQIGGYTLVGIEYEARLTDIIGVSIGGGLKGFTGGVKVHIGPSKNSPFFNFNYKDGGFGLLKTVGVDFGGRWEWHKKSGFGLHYQVIFAKINQIDRELEEELFGDSGAPDILITGGLGFSW